MGWRRELTKLGALLRRRKPVDDLAEEIRAHLQMEEQENLESGMAPDEAHYAALRRFGNVTLAQERSREMWGWNWAETLWQDLRFGLRQLRKNPGFTAVAVLTLALGIGANAAIFSVLYRALLRPLPYPHADRLGLFGMVVPASDARPFLFVSAYMELRHAQTPFESMASWRPGVNGCDVAEPHPARMACARVESTFLPTLGVSPVLGQNFASEEDGPDAPQVCLISYGLWQNRFGGSPAALNQLLTIDGKPTGIIGILPRDFEWPTLARLDIVLPEELTASERTARPGIVLRVYVRLKPGVSFSQARAQLQPIMGQFIQSAPPIFRKQIRLGLTSVREDQVGSLRLGLWLLFGATLALVLLASANVMNLLLARAAVRQREGAVRAALGASRWRLAQLRLVESTLLGLGGGIVGAGLAFLLLHICVVLAPTGIPRIGQVGLGRPELFLIVGMALLCGVLCGTASSMGVQSSGLLLAGRSLGPPHRRVGSVLVATQLAVSLVLLAGGGLLLDTLRNVENIPLGMDTNHIVTAEITLGSQPREQQGDASQFFQRLETLLRALPGVTGVVVSDSLPPTGAERVRPISDIYVQGRPAFEKGREGLVAWRAVTPGYFRMLAIPMVEGRGFVENDRDPQVNVIVISKTLAGHLFVAENPLGRGVQLSQPSGPWYDVIGVAGDVKNGGLFRPADPEYYVVRKSAPDPGLEGAMPPRDLRHAFFLVGSPLAFGGVERMVRGAIASLDPTLPATISTFDERVGRLRTEPRFEAVLISLFAGLGLMLAAIGLYGLVSYSVARRTQEIGVRMALGAEKNDVLRLVVGQGSKLTLIGVAIGIPSALGLTRFLSSLLYGVKPSDPLTFVAVSLLLTGVALLACYIPARRAAKVDPMTALRHE